MTMELRDLTLYLVDLAILREHLDQFYSYLSQDEAAKARKFKQLHLEENYVLTRGLLRSFLGHYLGVDPPTIRFKYNDRGKPFLSDHPLNFNLSHSDHWILFCFSPQTMVGVDLERIKPMQDVVGLAKRFFCPQESAFLDNLGDPFLQQQAFFSLWTGKEAYLKAIGTGLGGGLDSIQLTLDDNLQIIHWEQSDPPQPLSSWCIHRLGLPPNLVGAIALQQPERSSLPPVPLLTHQDLAKFL